MRASVLARALIGAAAWYGLAVSAASGDAGAAAAVDNETFEFKVPRGAMAPPVPADNPMSAAKVELGKQLYFDPRLSRDNTISCASCHAPDKGWSNGERFATGVRGQVGGRSAPTIMNAAYYPLQFWDGRAQKLEGQALGPIQNPIEMDMTLPEVVERLNAVQGYKSQFEEIFGAEVTADGIAKAIASFERTIISGDAPVDRYRAGDKGALTDAAQRGHDLFFGKAQCSACHVGANFSDAAFHNVGVGMDKDQPDEGRGAISGMLGDRGSFKTPSLRDVSRSAPYMHDGSFATLEDVVNHYNRGGVANPQLDEGIFPLNLSDQEKSDLVTFLTEGMSSSNYPLVAAPKLPE